MDQARAPGALVRLPQLVAGRVRGRSARRRHLSLRGPHGPTEPSMRCRASIATSCRRSASFSPNASTTIRARKRSWRIQFDERNGKTTMTMTALYRSAEDRQAVLDIGVDRGTDRNVRASRRALWPTSWPTPRREPARQFTGGQYADCHTEDHAVPVVRHRRRGGGEALRLDLQEFEDRTHRPLRRRKARKSTARRPAR